MNNKTLFEVYHKTRDEMEHVIAYRPNQNFGVMVELDSYAKSYRRYERLSRKIYARLMGKKFCPICGNLREVKHHDSNYSCSKSE